MPLHLHRDLEHLKREILTFGSMVENAAKKAILALVDRRSDLAEEVLRGDSRIDAREVEIEEECLKMLALHQSVAADLRFIIVVLKVNNDLERMGDLAFNIAERAVSLSTHSQLNLSSDLLQMAEAVQGMVRNSLSALIKMDTALARDVLARDDEIDSRHREMYVTLQKAIRKEPESVEQAIQLLSTSRYLERIADLTTNIAEDVVFMVDGDLIRHHAGP